MTANELTEAEQEIERKRAAVFDTLHEMACHPHILRYCLAAVAPELDIERELDVLSFVYDALMGTPQQKQA